MATVILVGPYKVTVGEGPSIIVESAPALPVGVVQLGAVTVTVPSNPAPLAGPVELNGWTVVGGTMVPVGIDAGSSNIITAGGYKVEQVKPSGGGE